MGRSYERGKWAEALATNYLEDQGLSLVARNYRWRGGEIDLILSEGLTLVFAEVRYRADTRFGDGAESVSLRKQRRLITTAERYLAQRPGSEPSCRFDVLSITGDPRAPEITWLKDAFDA